MNQESETEALLRAIPPPVLELAQTLRDKGHRTWAVGGSVRDIVLAHSQGQALDFRGDWDIATDARPEQVKKAFKKVIPTGILHGTVTVLLGSAALEVTTLRGERGHSDGRRPDEVFFVDDLVADLARRDFTVNAMAFDLATHQLEDPFGGRADLQARIIRAVGDAKLRYFEDGLRPLRGARFSAQLEMELESETQRAIRPSLERFRLVSKERVKDEWFKALKSKKPSRFLRIIWSEGLLGATLPEISLPVPGASDFDLERTLQIVDQAEAEPIRRLAHFLSPLVRLQFETEAAREDAAFNVGQALRLSNKERDHLTQYVRAFELPSADAPSQRRYLARLGRDFGPLALAALKEHGADDAQRSQLQQELESGAPLAPKELSISGQTLVQAGHKPGRELGRLLEALFQVVLDDPSQNRPELLLERAASIAAKS